MKFNWGYKILFVYLFFVIGILYMAFMSSRENYDLVQKDYYNEELKYQKVIDATSRATSMAGELITEVKGGKLIIKFPPVFDHAEAKGIVHLYFPADAKMDLKKEFITKDALLEIELLSQMKGNYTLKLEIDKDGVKYYFEKKIFL